MDGFPNLPNPNRERYVESFDGHMNRPGIHDYLQEMKENTLDRYDVFTVGEANGVRMENPEDVAAWLVSKTVFLIWCFNLNILDYGTKRMNRS